MNQTKKIFAKTFNYIILTIAILISLSGCANQNKEQSELQSKLQSEISYLDTQLISMLNKVNGLSFESYIVVAEQISQEGENSSKTKEGEKSNSNESSDNSGVETSSGEGGGSESESSSGGSSSEEGSQQKEKDYMDYKMEQNSVLASSKQPDWESLVYDIENLYSSWSTIVLDLYKINANGQDILNFNNDLDLAAESIKNQNKEQTLKNLSKLYSYIPTYASVSIKDTNKISVYQTKSGLLNAYALIGQNTKDEVKKQLSNAEQSFMPVINNIEDKNHQYNSNKAYVLLKELQNSIDDSNSDIFYIKYKNLIQELNILS